MICTSSIFRTLPIALAGGLCVPAAAASNPIEVTGVSIQIGPIGGPTPVPIGCGTETVVHIWIDVWVDPEEDFPSPSEQGNWVKVEEDDGFWSDGADFLDDRMGTADWTLPQSALLPNNTAIVYLTMPLGCDPKSDGICLLYGRDGAGGAKHYNTDDKGGTQQIYVQAGNLTSSACSDVVEVKCVNADGNAEVSDAEGEDGDTVVVEGRLDTEADIANVEWGVTYDPAVFMVAGAMFEPGVESMFAATQVDTSIPGTVRFIAESPVNLPPGALAGPLWFVDLTILPGTPPEDYEIHTTSDSVFTDQFLAPRGINRGGGVVLVAPQDAQPPVIDAELISMDLSADTIVGAPGAVLDDHMGDPGGAISLFLGHAPPDGVPAFETGVTAVAADGSFVIEGFVLHAAIADLELVAFDGRGNRTSVELAIPCSWSDDMESYAPGSSAHNQGDWRGWDNDPAATAAISTVQARSGDNAMEVSAAADLVHRLCTDGTGTWALTAWQYIPPDFSSPDGGNLAGSWFILLNAYDHGGPYEWAVQMQFNANTGMLRAYVPGPDPQIPYETDRWVKIQTIIDHDEDWTRIYYDDELVSEYPWSGAVFGTSLGVDLYAFDSSSVFYDDLGIEPVVIAPCPTDLNGDGATGTADLLELLSAWGANPGHPADFDGDGLVGTSDLLELLGQWGDCG